jgi:hypothetical protein
MSWLLAVLMLKVVAIETISSVDYWTADKVALRGSKWLANHGSELLGNVVVASPSPPPHPKRTPIGPPDYKFLKHRAPGFAADHPINRNYD